jgi:hypothetical protein
LEEDRMNSKKDNAGERKGRKLGHAGDRGYRGNRGTVSAGAVAGSRRDAGAGPTGGQFAVFVYHGPSGWMVQGMSPWNWTENVPWNHHSLGVASNQLRPPSSTLQWELSHEAVLWRQRRQLTVREASADRGRRAQPGSPSPTWERVRMAARLLWLQPPEPQPRRRSHMADTMDGTRFVA